MKTVLLVTREESLKVRFERELKKHFDVKYSPSTRDLVGMVDAVVYDLPRSGSSQSFHWLEAVDVPVVILTSEERFRASQTPKRSVLVYK